MAKLPFETQNLTDRNIEKIAALFPNVITENQGRRAQYAGKDGL
jgi:hypothetical protein